jgi:hypothetical protein
MGMYPVRTPLRAFVNGYYVREAFAGRYAALGNAARTIHPARAIEEHAVVMQSSR